jgi:hypothetical protein
MLQGLQKTSSYVYVLICQSQWDSAMGFIRQFQLGIATLGDTAAGHPYMDTYTTDPHNGRRLNLPAVGIADQARSHSFKAEMLCSYVSESDISLTLAATGAGGWGRAFCFNLQWNFGLLS